MRTVFVWCVLACVLLHASGREERPDDVKRFVDNTEEDGTVKIIWNDHSSYNGGWKNGKKTGTGTYMYADKKIYKGNWLDDLYHGVGVLRTPTGASYNGMWEYGLQHGQGELRYADGSLYFGDFMKNIQHGYGILKYMDGSSYEGNWVNGLPDGHGVVKKASGVVEYEGEFQKGRRIALVDRVVDNEVDDGSLDSASGDDGGSDVDDISSSPGAGAEGDVNDHIEL